MIFLSDKEQTQFCPKEKYSKFKHFNNVLWKNLDIYNSWHETSPQIYTQFCSKQDINVFFMCADRNLKNTLQFKFRNLRACMCFGGNFED